MYFSIEECLAAGWQTFKRRPGFFVLVPIVLLVISGVTSALISLVIGSDQALAQFIEAVAQFILQCFISLALCRITLHAVDDVGAASFADAWAPQFILQFALASLLYTIAVTLGMILLVIPGVIIGTMFAFALYPIAEQGMGAMAAFSLSRLITKGHRWRVFFFFIVLIIINMLGALALGVGLLVTMPVTALAVAHAYRALVAIADARPVTM